eukprot:403361740
MSKNLKLIHALRSTSALTSLQKHYIITQTLRNGSKEQIKPLKSKETWQYTSGGSSLSKKKINQRTADLINKKSEDGEEAKIKQLKIDISHLEFITPQKIPSSTLIILFGTSALAMLGFLYGINFGDYFSPLHTNCYNMAAQCFSFTLMAFGSGAVMGMQMINYSTLHKLTKEQKTVKLLQKLSRGFVNPVVSLFVVTAGLTMMDDFNPLSSALLMFNLIWFGFLMQVLMKDLKVPLWYGRAMIRYIAVAFLVFSLFGYGMLQRNIMMSNTSSQLHKYQAQLDQQKLAFIQSNPEYYDKNNLSGKDSDFFNSEIQREQRLIQENLKNPYI